MNNSQKPKLPVLEHSVHLPNELIYIIFTFCTSTSLLKLRFTSKQMKSIANKVLVKNLMPTFLTLSSKTLELKLDYNSQLAIKTPILDHYRGFLSAPTTSDSLTEIIWYANISREVQIVMECLCRLKGGISLPDNERMDWVDIKAIIKRSDFRMWLVCLATNVEFIRPSDAKKVEQIIRVDADITYERLREVSMAGYRLLIQVAACLQFSTIATELEMKRDKLEFYKENQENCANFLDSITLRL